MLVQEKQITKYLDDFRNGLITKGVGIGIHQADDYFRFKKGSFNMILGHDNVGKTYWRTWYYLVLSVKYNYKWCIWTGENKAGQIVRDLIQFYAGKRLRDIEIGLAMSYQQQVCEWFTFVDNSKTYKYNDLLNIFDKEDYAGCLIDPFTGLDRKYTHSENYDFLNATRQWVNSTGKTIDVCTHPVSASGRAGGMYPAGHHHEGYLKAPSKSDTEGGKPFANRCDDFYTIHRLGNHPTLKNSTMIFTEKIKETETGGQLTEKDTPVMFEFNNGLGFTCGGVNPITQKAQQIIPEKNEIKFNNHFMEKEKDDTQPF